MKILLTGASGFTGSHIAGYLTVKGHRVVATHRTKSKFNNCDAFVDLVDWVNTDDDLWMDKVVDYMPDLIVHTAWKGVDAANRNNADVQETNVGFMQLLLEIAQKCSVKKFISFGSQAEYADIPAILHQAYRIAMEDRPEPVLIYISMNLQHAECDAQVAPTADAAKPMQTAQATIDAFIATLHASLATCSKPLILAGRGIRNAEAADQFR